MHPHFGGACHTWGLGSDFGNLKDFGGSGI
jgi:hypothetical protein